MLITCPVRQAGVSFTTAEQGRGKTWLTVDGDRGDSNANLGFGCNLVLGEMSFGLIDELLGRNGTASPNEGRHVGPTGDGEGATREEPKLRNKERTAVNNILLTH